MGLGWTQLGVRGIGDCDHRWLWIGFHFSLLSCRAESSTHRTLSSRPVTFGEHRPGGRWKARESEQFTDRSLLVSYPHVSEAPSKGPPHFPQVIFVPAIALGALAITLSRCLDLVLPCNLPFASFFLGLLESPSRMWDRRGGSLWNWQLLNCAVSVYLLLPLILAFTVNLFCSRDFCPLTELASVWSWTIF